MLLLVSDYNQVYLLNILFILVNKVNARVECTIFHIELAFCVVVLHCSFSD